MPVALSTMLAGWRIPQDSKRNLWLRGLDSVLIPYRDHYAPDLM
ncbi:hypothetical protein ACUW97_001169 [Kocuria rhizophila]|nr:Uncharacterised protein [Kocuria rhizophila]